jgi:hypothetical protein
LSVGLRHLPVDERESARARARVRERERERESGGEREKKRERERKRKQEGERERKRERERERKRPLSVTRKVCSNCADRLPSLVTAVQLSGHDTSAQLAPVSPHELVA